MLAAQSKYISHLPRPTARGRGNCDPWRLHTVLYQDIQALLNEQVCIEDDQSERQRQNIVARSDLEKIADRFLCAAELALSLPLSFQRGVTMRQRFSQKSHMRVRARSAENSPGLGFAPSQRAPELDLALPPAYSWQRWERRPFVGKSVGAGRMRERRNEGRARAGRDLSPADLR